MKRKSLVIIEMLLSIIILVGIFFLIFNVYFIFKGFGKDILYINDKNREYIKNIIEKIIKDESNLFEVQVYFKPKKYESNSENFRMKIKDYIDNI